MVPFERSPPEDGSGGFIERDDGARASGSDADSNGSHLSSAVVRAPPHVGLARRRRSLRDEHVPAGKGQGGALARRGAGGADRDVHDGSGLRHDACVLPDGLMEARG